MKFINLKIWTAFALISVLSSGIAFSQEIVWCGVDKDTGEIYKSWCWTSRQNCEQGKAWQLVCVAMPNPK